jgi:DNA-binding NarL/FixJ family response regulator
MATVGVLDDHRSFAEALCMAIDATADLECVGIAGSMEGAADLARTLQPDVLILDYQLLDGDGLSLARELLADELSTRFLMLTAHASPDLRAQATSAGVSGFLAKDAPLSDVLAAVRSLAVAP